MDIRGLTLFIQDVRKAGSKQKEKERIDKELAKIRKYFASKNLRGYDRKKCVAKLLYVYMLGHEIEIGHIEAIALLTSKKFSEKHMGYLACSLLLNEESNLLRLITERCRLDIICSNPEHQCLALTCVGNIGGKEQSESLIQDVKKVLIGSNTTSVVRKKAALCLLNLYRKFPELLPPDTWSDKLIGLLSSRDLGVITSLMSLLLRLVYDNPTEYKGCVSKVVRLLVSLVINRQYLARYLYYGIPAPWLQIKLLRLLQYYPIPKDQAILQSLNSVIKTNIEKASRLRTTDVNKSTNRYNALHAVFFETLNLCIHYDKNKSILVEGANILIKYLDNTEANLRYLALDTMARLSYSKFSEVIQVVASKQAKVLLSLKDHDISIRRRALDVLYAMCNKSNASIIVGELLEYLALSDYAIREELVIKIAILAEKYATDLTWYVDVILSLIRESGDFVTDDIWYRVCQVVTNRDDEELQKYASKTVFEAVSAPSAHDVCVCVAAYILGEFGDLISEDDISTPLKQFKVLKSKFDASKPKTRSIILNTFVKLYNIYDDDDELRNKIKFLLSKSKSSFDLELQQRATEYEALLATQDADTIDVILDQMPPFTARESGVVKALEQRQKAVTEQKIRALKHVDENEKKKIEMEKQIHKEEKEDLKIPGGEEEEEEGEIEEENQTETGVGAMLDMEAPETTAKKQENSIFDDIFGSQPQKEQPKQPVQIQQPKQVTGTGSLLDFMGGGDTVGNNTTTNNNDGFDPDEMIKQKIDAFYQELLILKIGTMFEGEGLKMRMKGEFRNGEGRIGIYYKNVSTSDINLTTSVENFEELEISSSDVSKIEVGREVPHYFKILCLSPFEGKPHLTIQYNTGFKNCSFKIPLPVVVHKFISGVEVEGKNEFFKLWNSIDQNDEKFKQSTFQTKTANGYNIQKLRVLLKSGINCTLYDGISSPTNSIICGGKFNSQNGSHIVLVRLQINKEKGAVRITTKSSSKIVNQQIHQMITDQINRL